MVRGRLRPAAIPNIHRPRKERNCVKSASSVGVSRVRVEAKTRRVAQLGSPVGRPRWVRRRIPRARSAETLPPQYSGARRGGDGGDGGDAKVLGNAAPRDQLPDNRPTVRLIPHGCLVRAEYGRVRWVREKGSCARLGGGR